MADGGEGTCDLLTHFILGKFITTQVQDPLGRRINAQYGTSQDGSLAYIEMAHASGLQLLNPAERNCSLTSTYGTGQLIVHAMDGGAAEVVIGIGGSATNDAGTGMAQALGFRLQSKTSYALKGIGANLIQMKCIDDSQIHPRLKQTRFTVLCDVDNPLFGVRGAAYTFAKQKGASDEEIKMLDDGLRNFSMLGAELNFPGAGAAGGLGAGAKLFLQAKIQSGIAFVMDFVKLEEKIIWADVVITGEGKIDHQTLSGKVVNGVAMLVKKHHKKLIAVCGACELAQDQAQSLGLSQVITLKAVDMPEHYAIKNAASILSQQMSQVTF